MYVHVDTKHVADFSHQEYQQKVNELEGSLGSQESMFEKVTAIITKTNNNIMQRQMCSMITGRSINTV